MKKYVFLLVLTVLGGGLWGGVYAADCPSVFGVYNCGIGGTCNNPGGTCSCTNTATPTINHGSVCTNSDGIRTILTGVGAQCDVDVDGCTCYDTDGTNKGDINYGATCTWSTTPSDTTAPVLVGDTSVSVTNNSASFGFTCSENNVTISCLGSCGSCSLTANSGNNTVTFSSLANSTYSNCSLIGYDAANNPSLAISVPAFTINYTTPSGGGGGGGGGGGTPACYLSDLTCVNGVYQKKNTSTYCAGGSLGLSCNLSSGFSLISGFYDGLSGVLKEVKGLDMSGFQSLIQSVQTGKQQSTSTIHKLTGDGQFTVYTQQFSSWPIKKLISTLEKNLVSSLKNQWMKNLLKPYTISDYEKVMNQRVTLSKDIGALVQLHNEFVATLYLILDKDHKELLPVIKYYIKVYFSQTAAFSKKTY